MDQLDGTDGQGMVERNRFSHLDGRWIRVAVVLYVKSRVKATRGNSKNHRGEMDSSDCAAIGLECRF